MIRTYSELITLPTFEERYQYLKLNGKAGEETFGAERYLNQIFYSKDPAWKSLRNQIILRDNACDLAIPDRPIFKYLFVHHINPITKEDILNRTDKLLDPENLICVSERTHNAIHFSDEKLLDNLIKDRTPNDMCPWRR